MSANEAVTFHALVSDPNLLPAPLDPSWILEGSPQARARPLSVLPDGTISATLWDCTAGRFHWHYGGDEIIVILDGEVEITSPAGILTTLRAGDLAHFSGGAVSSWHVRRYVRKVALYSSRTSLPRRLAQRIPLARRIVHRIRAQLGQA